MARKHGRPTALPVLFRKHRDEGVTHVTAVFPTEPGSVNDPDSMLCYSRVGQHASCSDAWRSSTEPATPDEAAGLLAELRSIYERAPNAVALDVRLRITPAMREANRRKRKQRLEDAAPDPEEESEP